MKTCSLVCHTFLHICRKHIFESIFLNASTIRAFGLLLRNTPEIGDYIRELVLLFFRVEDLVNTLIQESFKRISRLEILRVHPRITPRLDWSSNTIRPLLLHLLHLPTLTQFIVEDFDDFVVSDLIPCVNLKYLDIGFLTTVAAKNTFPATLPKHSIQLNELGGAPTTIMNLCTAQRPDGQPIIDFVSLIKITADINSVIEREASQDLFRHFHALTHVQITFRRPRDVRPNLAHMLRPLMQTLKHIVVIILDVGRVNFDPLFGIPSDLEDMRNNNAIEIIEISVEIVSFSRELEDNWDVAWVRLDEVLTALGWVSLKRVSLNIKIRRYSLDATELDVALRNSIMTKFPRLSSSNSVSFDLKVKNVMYE